MSFDHDPTEINALAILGADPDVRELASLEQLRTMATLAPRLRNMTEAQRARALRLESGRSTSVGEVVDSCVARAGIELDVVPLEGPKRLAICAICGTPFRVARGRMVVVCAKDECRHPLCACGCGTRGPNRCMTPKLVARRGGAPWKCRIEAGRKSVVGRTREQLAEAGRKGSAAISTEQRRIAAKKTQAAKSPEQRRAAGLKAAATRKARRTSH